MSEQESTLDDFTRENNDSQEESDQPVAVGELQQLEASPIESWKLVKLGDILTLEYGDNLPSDSRKRGEVPVYGSNGQVDTHVEAAVDKPGIVLGRKGSIGEIEFSDGPFWPIDTTYYITDKETDQNLRFLYYLLQNIQLERLNAASAIPGLNRNDTYGLNALTPPLEEQRKIASVLYTVDQAIQKNNEVISQTKKLKRGVMQDLFSEGYLQHKEHDEGNIRWKQVPSSWNLPKLSEVVEVNPRYDDVDRPVDYIEMDAVDTVLPEPEYIGKRNPAENSGRIFKKGDTLFARITPCTENGKICFVDNISSEIGIGSTEYAVLSPEKEELLPKYLYHYCRTHQVRNYAISRMRGSTGRQRVPFDVFRKELRIPMPPREEQKLIVEYLDSIDEVIRNGRQNKNQLQRLKQGLMQDLLSGEVRTHDKDIEILDDVFQYG